MLTEPSLMVSGHGAMSFDHAAYTRMAMDTKHKVLEYRISGMEVLAPADAVAIATYRVHQKMEMDGKWSMRRAMSVELFTWVVELPLLRNQAVATPTCGQPCALTGSCFCAGDRLGMVLGPRIVRAQPKLVRPEAFDAACGNSPGRNSIAQTRQAGTISTQAVRPIVPDTFSASESRT